MVIMDEDLCRVCHGKGTVKAGKSRYLWSACGRKRHHSRFKLSLEQRRVSEIDALLFDKSSINIVKKFLDI